MDLEQATNAKKEDIFNKIELLLNVLWSVRLFVIMGANIISAYYNAPMPSLAGRLWRRRHVLFSILGINLFRILVREWEDRLGLYTYSL